MNKLFFIAFMLSSTMAMAQKEISLYNVIPNNKPSANIEKSEINEYGLLIISHVSIPTVTIYKPSAVQKPNGTAVIICPGGGYGILAAGHEGSDIAREFNKWGVTAFVLKYRIPDQKTMEDKSIAPLQDAERAIQMVRQHAKTWGVNPRKIGVMGFSAGGHLAAGLSTRYKEILIDNPKNISLRPDFSLLIYPVISFTDSLTNVWSRNNLLGKNPLLEKIRQYSNELNVNENSPPAFLVHARDDDAVNYHNSTMYYDALKKNNVEAELKLFEKGGHGFGMNNKTTDEKWMDDLKIWMQKMNFL
jgi:acetyl esterase/lipase